MQNVRQSYKKKIAALAILALLVLPTLALSADINHVIIVSVDGLRGDAIASIPASDIPNLKELATGSATFNARTDYDYTETLQNHSSMVTSRPVLGDSGHNWTGNTDPPIGETFHSNKGEYVAGVFDVAHDNGLYTAMYAGKSKFSLFDTSYNATYGNVDTTGQDNGRDKIDKYLYSTNSASQASSVINDLTAHAASGSLIFLHFYEPDAAGHSSGWMGTAYLDSIKQVDGYLGQIMAAIRANPVLYGHTAIILTADHGGTGTGHSAASVPTNYTIPFLVWLSDDQGYTDLYSLNLATRTDPLTGRPNKEANPQPIRNAEAGNLALSLLALPPIPGSVYNAALDLKTHSVCVGDFNIDGDVDGSDLFKLVNGERSLNLLDEFALDFGSNDCLE